MENDLVSIIVPVYNTEKYIRMCVDSILNQSFKNIEIILIDDESSDSCCDICDMYSMSESRVKVIHQKNMGLGMVRNNGLKHASGKFVTFIDSDDWIDQNHIRNMVCGIIDCDLVIGCNKQCTQSGNLIKQRKSSINGLYTKEDIINKIMLRMIAPDDSEKNELAVPMSVCFNLYRMDIIRENNLTFFSERYCVGEDIFFNLDYLNLCKKVNCIEEYGYNYRMNEASITHTYKKERIKRTENYYKELTVKVADLGIGAIIGHRVERSTLSKYRKVIELLINSDNSFFYKWNELKQILNSDILKNILKDYPISTSRLSLRVLNIAMKYRIVSLTFVIFVVASWRS